jgi:cobalamin biosynthesis protein CbiG
LKSALGPDRFKAYLRTEQPAYRNMARVVEQLKLPPEALEASMTVIIEAETRTMRQGDRLPPGDPYAREIRERLEKVLGPGGVEQALEVYPIPYLWNRGN